MTADANANGTTDNRLELKYLFDQNHAPVMHDWAAHCLLPDPRFPVGGISSIYFDDHLMSGYYEKRNSDFFKSKLRLRWYDVTRDAAQSGTAKCYLELKGKCGPVVSKQRVSADIQTKYLEEPFSQFHSFRGLLIERATHLDCDLMRISPSVLIRYQRHRFVDPESGSRVAIDTAIRADANPTESWVSVASTTLQVGVLEIKGSGRHLPNQLRAIAPNLVRESFSKYARCCEYLSQPVVRRT